MTTHNETTMEERLIGLLDNPQLQASGDTSESHNSGYIRAKHELKPYLIDFITLELALLKSRQVKALKKKRIRDDDMKIGTDFGKCDAFNSGIDTGITIINTTT